MKSGNIGTLQLGSKCPARIALYNDTEITQFVSNAYLKLSTRLKCI